MAHLRCSAALAYNKLIQGVVKSSPRIYKCLHGHCHPINFNCDISQHRWHQWFNVMLYTTNFLGL
jgi:hypothetical protein